MYAAQCGGPGCQLRARYRLGGGSDDFAKSKIDGRVAVTSRTCPDVTVSVGAPHSRARRPKVLPRVAGTSRDGTKGSYRRDLDICDAHVG